MKKYLLIALIVVLFIAAAVIIMRKSGARSPEVSPEAAEKGLYSFRLSSSGDSLGSTSDLELVRVSDEKWSLTLRTRESANAKEKTRKTAVDADLIESVERIIMDNSMDSWADFPKSDVFAFDAATTSLEYRWNGKDYRFDSNQEFPDGGWAAVRSIEDVLMSCF